MLVGVSENDNRILARDASKESKFFCPSCQEQLILKKGNVKIHHFAHKAESTCLYAGESLDHLNTKLQIYDALLQHPKVINVELEKPLGLVRPDIMFTNLKICDNQCDKGCFTIIEIQNSPIEISEIQRRNIEYNNQRANVLWVLPNKLVPKFNHKMECKTTQWQRYLYEIYDEKIYFHVSGLDVFPLHYEQIVRKYDKSWLAEHDYIETGKALVNTKRMKMYKNLNIIDDFSFTMYEHIARNYDIDPVYFQLWADEHGLWWNTKDSGVK